MNHFSARIAAAIAAGSMALTAIPAGAVSVNVDSSVHTSSTVESSTTNGTATARYHNFFSTSGTGAKASTSLNVKSSMRCRFFTGEALARCEKVLLEKNGTGSVTTETHGNIVREARGNWVDVQARVHTRMESMLKRIINGIGKLARRACSGNDTVTLEQCMSDMKARVKLNVSAMIDAAFSVN